jgi:hypothetical protein
VATGEECASVSVEWFDGSAVAAAASSVGVYSSVFRGLLSV